LEVVVACTGSTAASGVLSGDAARTMEDLADLARITLGPNASAETNTKTAQKRAEMQVLVIMVTVLVTDDSMMCSNAL
jgi:hypothetical protein